MLADFLLEWVEYVEVWEDEYWCWDWFAGEWVEASGVDSDESRGSLTRERLGSGLSCIDLSCLLVSGLSTSGDRTRVPWAEEDRGWGRC